MTIFFKEYMMPGLAFCTIFVAIATTVSWLCYVLHSIARAADALERIADALEDDEECDESEVR